MAEPRTLPKLSLLRTKPCLLGSRITYWYDCHMSLYMFRSLSDQIKFPRDVIDDQRPSLPPLDLSNADGRLIPAAMCFSSGTSGKPKGVLLSHYGLIAHLLTLRSTDPFLNHGHHREVFFAPCKLYSFDAYWTILGLMISKFRTYTVLLPS